MTEPLTLQEALEAGGAWVIAALLSGWVWVLKTALGRYMTTVDGVSAQLASIDKRLSRIEGRFDERDNK